MKFLNILFILFKKLTQKLKKLTQNKVKKKMKQGKQKQHKKRNKHNSRLASLEAIATITGTTIGAGFLGIPYVVAKSGFLIGVIHIIILGFMIILTNLMIGETMLRTKQFHQLPGYVEKYLGKKAKLLMIFASMFGIYAALIAYFIGEGQTLSFIFTGTQQYTLLFSILFFMIIVPIVYFGIEMLKKSETVTMFIVIGIILLLCGIFLPKIHVENLTYIAKKSSSWFFPYGVVLFSLLSFSALPEVRQEIVKNEKVLKKSIIIGTLIPIVFYTLFTLMILGFAGANTPEIATIALGKIPSLLAIFTMFTACVALSNAIRDVYRLDLKLKYNYAFLLSVPFAFFMFLIFYIFNLVTFIKALEIGGAVSGGLTGIMTILTALKAKKKSERKPEYSIKIPTFLIVLLMLIYLAGIITIFI